jgi:adenosylcobinamide kinase/adenosylcobinamide-phosphate guanylyltransferase
MAHIHFITGGQRSGKSSFSERVALKTSDHPVYVATSRVWDEDFQKRIDRHQLDRSDAWVNIEEEKYISTLDIPAGSAVLVDCITLWLTNFFTDHEYDVDAAMAEAKAEWDRFIQKDISLFVVSNEVGMSLHAETEVGRKFVDLQGWMNQYIAKGADKVSLMVSGIELVIK